MPTTTNYLNPQAVNPGYDFKPNGVLGGYMWGQDRQRYDALAPLQDLMAQMSAQEQTEKMKEYGLNAQVREAERGSKVATANATAGTIDERLRGEAEQLTNENKYKSGTLASRIAETISENAAKEGPRAIAKIQQGAAIASSLAQASGSGPAAMASVTAAMKKAGLDQNDPVVQFILQGKTPLEIQQRAKLMADSFDQASSHFRESMAKQELENKGHLEAQKEASRASIAAAGIRANKAVTSVIQDYKEALKKGNHAGVYQIGSQLLASPDLNESDRAVIKEQVVRAKKMWAQQQARGQGAVISPEFAPPGGGAIEDRVFGDTPAQTPIINFKDLK